MTVTDNIAMPGNNAPSSHANLQLARKRFDEGRKACATDSQRFAVHAFAEAICLDPGQRQYPNELLAVLSSGHIVVPGILATVWRLRRQMAEMIATSYWQLVLEHGRKLFTR